MAANFLDGFFLVFDEGEDLTFGEHDVHDPRRCFIEAGVDVVGVAQGSIVVRVDPPYGRRGIAIHEIVLAPMAPSLSLRELISDQAPVDIYHIRSEMDVPSGRVVISPTFDRIGMGTITASEDDARAFAQELRPDFYLVLEHPDRAAGPWNCHMSRTRTSRRSVINVLVTVDPGLPGDLLGKPRGTISKLVLARATPDTPLLPIDENPVHVHVYQVLVDRPSIKEKILPNDLMSIGTGELYDSQFAARARVRQLTS